MSYIRCLSNPEGLYVHEDMDSYIHISWIVKPPLSSGKEDVMLIPYKAFYGGIRKWDRTGRCKNFKGFSIKERYIYLKTGKPVSKQDFIKSFEDKKHKGYRVRLSYQNKFVYLWSVTWEYIVQNSVNRD